MSELNKLGRKEKKNNSSYIIFLLEKKKLCFGYLEECDVLGYVRRLKRALHGGNKRVKEKTRSCC